MGAKIGAGCFPPETSLPHVSGLAEASAGLAENHIVYPDENFKRLAGAAGIEPATS